MSRAFFPPLLTLCFLVASCASTVSTMPAGTAGALPNLAATEWLLEDLGGAKVLDQPQATLAFLDGNRAAGSGACNRFTGTHETSENSIKFGPIASTRRACVPAVMSQEDKYLAALQNAERIALGGPALLIYSKGADKPLRLTRMAAAKPAQ